MTDEEIEAVAGKIVAEVGKRTGGVLRGLGHLAKLAGGAASERRLRAYSARASRRSRRG